MDSLVQVIKACRKAFDDPAQLDEYETMDKLAGLFANVENILVSLTLGGRFSVAWLVGWIANLLDGWLVGQLVGWLLA